MGRDLRGKSMNKCLNTVSEQYGKCSNTWWCTYSQRNTEEVSQDPPWGTDGGIEGLGILRISRRLRKIITKELMRGGNEEMEAGSPQRAHLLREDDVACSAVLLMWRECQWQVSTALVRREVVGASRRTGRLSGLSFNLLVVANCFELMCDAAASWKIDRSWQGWDKFFLFLILRK